MPAMSDGTQGKNHPVHKSLTVFPVIPDKSYGVISLPSNTALKEKKPKKPSAPKPLRFNRRMSVGDKNIKDSADREEILMMKQTKTKLERVADLLPGTDDSMQSMHSIKLPPITSYVRQAKHTSAPLQGHRSTGKSIHIISHF